jgi:hypothetical protein
MARTNENRQARIPIFAPVRVPASRSQALHCLARLVLFRVINFPLRAMEGTVMRRSVIAAMMVAMLSGCAAMREDHSLCVGVCTGTGALLGATAGGLASGLTLDDGDETNGEIAAATGGGTAFGALVGWALSNAICEEPPPPPPPPARTPPPPPAPPPTERRGG